MSSPYRQNALAGPSAPSRPLVRNENSPTRSPRKHQGGNSSHSPSSPHSKSPERNLRNLHISDQTPSDSYDDSEDTEERRPLIVRAVFDFEAADPSALSFSEGDLIEVMTMLESGWWDGILGNERGWFPSNYVQVVEDVEEEYEEEEDVGGKRRTVLSEGEALGMEDALGAPWGAGEDDLEALARSMGVESGDKDEPEGGEGYMLSPRRTKGRADTIDSQSSVSTANTKLAALPETSPSRPRRTSSADEDEEYEAGPSRRREREDTAGTIRGESRTLGGHTTPMARLQGQGGHDTPKARERGRDSNGPSLRSDQGERGDDGAGDDDAWIPCLTPDGQVYYHNTQTGEDSWELPMGTPEDDDSYEGEETDYFPTPNSVRPTSSDQYHTSSSVPDPGGGFGPTKSEEIPYPWISRLSDDGSRYYYINRLTGAESYDFPKEDMVRRESNAMGDMDEDRSGTVPPPAARPDPPSTRKDDDRSKATSDWERQSRRKLSIALRPAQRSSLGIMLEIINETLREVFEASVAGSAAEEEMSRAVDLGSESGRIAAISKEETAVEMLKTSHRDLLSSITDLLRAYGYVGPIDVVEEMPRPTWTVPMLRVLIGSIALFTANVHAALRSKRIPESGLSVWQEVSKSGSKLRDVLTDFPEIATGGKATGRALWGWIGIDEPIGGLYAGRWGFGSESDSRRELAGDVVREADRVRGEFEAAIQGQKDDLALMRIAEKFKTIVSGVDIAAAIDIDGPVAGKGENDVSRKYEDLVFQAKAGLGDLDKAVLDIDRYIYSYYLALTSSSNTSPALTSLNAAITSSSRSLSNLLIVSGEQKGMVRTTGVKGRIGLRSPNYTPFAPGSTESKHRPLSIVSVLSRGSRTSRSSGVDEKRAKVRGLEDDFQDSEERLERSTHGSQENSSDREPRRTHQSQQRMDRDGNQTQTRTSPSPISASGSQSSLARIATGQTTSHRHQPSAGSSVTSLGYQRTDSDGSSVRGGGQRASTLMKGFFGRNRDHEAELREKAEKAERDRIKKEKGNKKLAKMFGEDVSHLPVTPPPPPQPPIIPPVILQQQLQRQQSLSNSVDMRTPPSASFGHISMPPPTEMPWYLSEDYVPEEIIFDDKGGVKAGTLRALVVRLTPHGSTDTSFFQAFMLTFRSFTSGDKLLELLSERFDVPAPAGMNEFEDADWTKNKQTPIRLRVANVLRAWLDVHFMPDQDEPMLDMIEGFAHQKMVDAVGSEMLKMLAKTLLNIIARRRRNEDPNQRRITSGGLLSPPAPIVPRNSGRSMQITDIAPLEFARQLTVIEFNNFQRIKPGECLHKAWTVEDETKGKNVRLVIHTANKLAAWIGLLVLEPKEPKNRANLMKYFITVAMELRGMNNFSSMAGVVAGLNAAPVDRLKRTKELLSTKTMAMKLDLDRTMDSSKNFANYKEMLKTINPPCVPFLGFYLSALTFIEDGNKDTINPAVAAAMASRGMSTSASSSSLASTNGYSINRSPIQPLTSSTSSNVTPSSAITSPPSSTTPIDPSLPPKEPLINFFKRGLSAEILRDIQQYQSQPYNLAKCKPVHEFLVAGLKDVEANGGNDELYARSLMLEPREREEERIQRMLHDSGFI